MNDCNALKQLHEDILEVFPPGSQRDVWLAFLAGLTSASLWRDVTQTLH